MGFRKFTSPRKSICALASLIQKGRHSVFTTEDKEAWTRPDYPRPCPVARVPNPSDLRRLRAATACSVGERVAAAERDRPVRSLSTADGAHSVLLLWVLQLSHSAHCVT